MAWDNPDLAAKKLFFMIIGCVAAFGAVVTIFILS